MIPIKKRSQLGTYWMGVGVWKTTHQKEAGVGKHQGARPQSDDIVH